MTPPPTCVAPTTVEAMRQRALKRIREASGPGYLYNWQPLGATGTTVPLEGGPARGGSAGPTTRDNKCKFPAGGESCGKFSPGFGDDHITNQHTLAATGGASHGKKLKTGNLLLPPVAGAMAKFFSTRPRAANCGGNYGKISDPTRLEHEHQYNQRPLAATGGGSYGKI